MEDRRLIKNQGALVLGANIEIKKIFYLKIIEFYFYVVSRTRFFWTLELEFYVNSSILFLCGLLLGFWVVYINPLSC